MRLEGATDWQEAQSTGRAVPAQVGQGGRGEGERRLRDQPSPSLNPSPYSLVGTSLIATESPEAARACGGGRDPGVVILWGGG